MELGLPEPQDMISSSTSSVFVAQKPVLPCCDCKNVINILLTVAPLDHPTARACLTSPPVFSEETILGNSGAIVYLFYPKINVLCSGTKADLCLF